MMEMDRFYSEHLWLFRLEIKTVTGLRRETETVLKELGRQREARGLWYPTMITRMPVLQELIIRTLAKSPRRVADATHNLEFNFRVVLDGIERELKNRQRELREVKQAMNPFLSGSENVCPCCWLGFDTPHGLSTHTKADKCLINWYPQHAALLHWTFQLVRSELKFDPADRMEKIFEEEAKARGTKYTVSEAIGPYSRVCMAIGLISFLIPGPPSSTATRTDLRTAFTHVIQAMNEDGNMDNEIFLELLEKIMREYEALNVSLLDAP
jgi:hypothetical protein